MIDAHSMKTNLAWALCAYFMELTTKALDAAEDTDECTEAFINYNRAGSAWCEAEDYILAQTEPLYEPLQFNTYDCNPDDEDVREYTFAEERVRNEDLEPPSLGFCGCGACVYEEEMH